MIFSKILEDLKMNFTTNRNFFMKYSKSNPNMVYSKINEIAQFVGARYGIDLKLHFPDPSKIYILDSYGSENIGIVVDKFKKNFSISRELVKSKAIETIDGAFVSDAYMYEGKEGVRISFKKGRLEVLPGSIHIWSSIDKDVENYVNWIFTNVLVKH
ncbi:MAG TPA: hypothetical protein VFY77_05205 [Nitrososphaeraceae archaeon]|nr:hypothetical protein [Nitrososphaeraceae archaeon]